MDHNKEDYDVVVDTLQKHFDKLFAMDHARGASDFLGYGVMQQIRAQQCSELQEAIRVWKKYKQDN